MNVVAGPTHLMRARRWRVRVPLLALAASALLAVNVQPARAVILPATTIDGPSPDIVGFGGVAMAEDGTGGLVYLKRVNGVPQVFVSRFVEGHWQAPIRVDQCRIALSAEEQKKKKNEREEANPAANPTPPAGRGSGRRTEGS